MGKITGHGDPISFRRLEQLKEKAENATCIINSERGMKGSGFFFKYTIKEEDKYFLITMSFILDSNSINNNNYISIIYKNKEETIGLKNRLIGTNKKLDYTIIEILKEDEIFNKINNYFEIDTYIMNNESQNYYLNQDICIVQYPDGGELSFAQGGIQSFDDYKIKHLVSTHHGSSGSPILLQNNFKIIGIHKAGNRKKNENIGIFFQNILTHFLSQNNFITNQIICEYNIKNKNEDIQILNCYEEAKKQYPQWPWDKIGCVENEKEIKDKSELYLNNKKNTILF